MSHADRSYQAIEQHFIFADKALHSAKQWDNLTNHKARKTDRVTASRQREMAALTKTTTASTSFIDKDWKIRIKWKFFS